MGGQEPSGHFLDKKVVKPTASINHLRKYVIPFDGWFRGNDERRSLHLSVGLPYYNSYFRACQIGHFSWYKPGPAISSATSAR